MPAEQRVITIGFAVVALVILGILLALFSGPSPTDALDELQGLFGEYQSAEERGNYSAMRTKAEEILVLLDDAGRRTIESNLEPLAVDGNRKTMRLQKMLRAREFEKNAEGLFRFDGQMYPVTLVRNLRDLQKVVASEFSTLRRARKLAAEMQEAVEHARMGSGQPIPLPKPDAADLALPGMDSNPLLDSDARLFAVFALDPDLMVGALNSKNPGGRANSKRITWNRDMPGRSITKTLKELPAKLPALSEVAGNFASRAEAVDAHPQGAKAAAKIYKDACDAIANGVTGDARAAFDANRAAVEKGAVIAAILRAEEKLLRKAEARMAELADTFQLKFP